MAEPIRIVYEDEYFFAIDKPSGFFVHPPEYSAYPTPREKICLYVLEQKFNRAVYPIHRLDSPTSGLVLFAFSKDATRKLSRLFADREIKKTYHAVTRGFIDPEGEIGLSLEIKGFREPIDALTKYSCLGQREFACPVGTKYQTARYSLVEINPITGRWHQIRRHFDRIAHPLLGDIEHGDSHHNRFFRDHLKIPGLCLRARDLTFKHPWSAEALLIEAPDCERWQRIYSLFSDSPL
jgi:tRNA pseudouridine65 synthase